MSAKLKLFRRGIFGAPEGSEKIELINTPGMSRLFCDGRGNMRMVPIHSVLSTFEFLPAASVAAGADPHMISLGTGTEVIARAAKGGVNVKTQATTPADNDNVMLIPATNLASRIPITTVSQPRFSAMVSLTQITELVAGFGLDENFTSPVGSATAGDGAQFYFDPAKEVTTGLADGAEANWILAMKKAGADTYIDSGIPVVAGRLYLLEIAYGDDLKPVYFIDGKQVGVGAAAGTADAVVGPVLGVQINAASPAGQKDFNVRYVLCERFTG